MKKSQLTATKLRVMLSVTVVLLIGLSAVGFYFGQGWLRKLAVTVSHTVAESQAGGSDIISLKKLQESLLARQDIINKAGSLVASAQNSQSQTIQDLDKYAADAGISISNYTFIPTVAPAAAAAGTPQVTTTAAASSTSVTVTLVSPLSYTKLLRFMSAVENNLPKMQVSSVNLGRVPDAGSDAVRTDQLTIEVYTQ